MDFDRGSPAIIKTTNRNRNMVLALLQRVPPRPENTPLWEDGLARFGVDLLFGFGDRIHLFADFFPYEWDQEEANDNA